MHLFKSLPVKRHPGPGPLPGPPEASSDAAAAAEILRASLRRPGDPAESHAAKPFAGAKYYTPEITEVKFNWNMSLKVHWTIPVNIHWTSDNPLENATEIHDDF